MNFDAGLKSGGVIGCEYLAVQSDVVTTEWVFALKAKLTTLNSALAARATGVLYNNLLVQLTKIRSFSLYFRVLVHAPPIIWIVGLFPEISSKFSYVRTTLAL